MISSRLAPYLATAAVVGATLTARSAAADDAACINASESALALRKQGQLRSALQQLAVCADVACPIEVRSDCAHRVDEARGAEPTLILAVKDAAGNDVLGVSVTLDGAPLPGALDGRAITLDPGEHSFTFTAPGRPPVEKKLVLHESEKDRRETIVLASNGAPSAPPPPAPLPQSAWSTSKTLAIVAGGIGVVGIGVGAGLGLSAISSQNKEKSDCPSAGCTGHAQAVSDYNSAHSDGIASTIAFGAGAAFVIAGFVLWFTAPRSQESGPPPAAARFRVVPVVGDRSAGLVFGGAL